MVPSSDELVVSVILWQLWLCQWVSQYPPLQHEVQILHQRVATEISEIENKLISGESIQSTVSYIMYTVPKIGYTTPTSQ